MPVNHVLADNCAIIHSAGSPEWPAYVQAIGSILAIAVSVYLARWSQQHALVLSHRTEARRQLAALIGIADQCVEMLERLNRRAINNQVSKHELSWLIDECEMSLSAINSVDLMSIIITEAIPLIASLQRLTRTARRRLNTMAMRIRANEDYNHSDFHDAFQSSLQVRENLREIQVI